MAESSPVTTFLFTDIEGSSRLWETDPAGMQPAMARHDALVRRSVLEAGGTVVKMTGDGVCAAFSDPLDAVHAVMAFQRGLGDVVDTAGVALRARCGVHLGIVERRDNDYFGNPVNRAARIMSAAHGGQVLLSQAVVDLVRDRLGDDAGLRDLGSVRLRDLATPEHLYQLTHPALRAEFPPLRSLAATPNNLPQQVTSFVGRQRELAEVRALLNATRLLTLHGAGGIGKTRLSLQLAGDVLDEYPDGVWLVELAPIHDGRLVAQAVASVLGVKEEGGRPVAEALVREVGELSILLVLDNCEHLLADCAALAEQLLRAGRHLRILASSREPLHIAGESVYPVPALALPEPGAPLDVDALARCEAVRLFGERAAASLSSFKLGPHNAAAVVDICRRLDGIPLAIELAAARTRALPVETIATRLGDRFRLLTSGDRSALPRQQTLRALIDWSYELLRPNERTLFRRLAVFAGGFTLEAAENVAAAGDVASGDVLDLLTGLVEKSLVAVDAEGGRYSLLETMREYANDRLVASDEGDAVHRRHLDHLVSLAEAAGPQLSGPDQAAWLRRIDDDRENVVSALAWCRDRAGVAESACRLVNGVKLYWFMRGLLDLGYRMTELAISLPADDEASQARCRALWVAGQIASYAGRYREAQRHLEDSLAIAKRGADAGMVASIENVLALTALGMGDRTAARRHGEAALALAREAGSERELAAASNSLAQLSRLEGDYAAAERLYEEAVKRGRAMQHREFTAIGLIGQAMAAIARGEGSRAAPLLREALDLSSETGSTPTQQGAVEVAAGLAASQGDFERCAKLFGAAEAHAQRTGIRRDPADQAFLEPWLAMARERLGSRFSAAEAVGRASAFDDAVREVREAL